MPRVSGKREPERAINIKVPVSLYDALKEVCKREDWSMAQFVRKACRQRLAAIKGGMS